MEILYKKEVVEYLGLPGVPKKEWDGKSSFNKGVAVITLYGERKAYAAARFDAETDTEPRITKVFSIERYHSVEAVFVVPPYMTTEDEVEGMDLDEQSKKKVEAILKEAKEIEDEGVEDDKELTSPKNEYYFDHIHTDEEACAYIQAYNSRNKIRGKIPSTHEGLVMRLAVIYSDNKKKKK